MKDLFVFVMLKLLSRALQYIKQKKMLVTKRLNMSPISRNHHYFQYSTESMVRRTCNLWLTTRFVLVPVPCVDCSDAKLFGGFLFICFFSSTTGSSFNIPIVSFNGVFVKVIQISGYVFRWWTLYFGLNITRTHDILVNSRWQDHCTTALTSSE